jgi:acetolactate synthase I/II/III large subunit
MTRAPSARSRAMPQHGHAARAVKRRAQPRRPADGADGYTRPNGLLAAIQDAAGPEAVPVTDGGDFPGFARVGLSARTMPDPGRFGRIGVGVPYGIAAALAAPGRTVVVATGDGAIGFNAMELDTAQRHAAPVPFVVANSGAWPIEVRDQNVTHGRAVGLGARSAALEAWDRAERAWREG